jgi:hypothetical protein
MGRRKSPELPTKNPEHILTPYKKYFFESMIRTYNFTKNDKIP